ncbi:SGNH hydrolase [Ophiobolus disseminans]|uniref:SGNH hydrolase n=1 Tax=Ophiobolus disseminans TaxID=1469910 RepID=A0A6A7A5Z3_9PLEO|nr:SGNH hydrolase [Ophiobolus disseminans]
MLRREAFRKEGYTLLIIFFLLGHPRNVPLIEARADKFVFGAIGDSWASGITWNDTNSYDGGKDDCHRYKYAWSTVIDGSYAKWTPDAGKEPEFEFKACSGARLENMNGQMDKMTRPKLVFMEAREIYEVRKRVNNGMQEYAEENIDAWRAHRAVAGNEATLIVLGYAGFFALGDECNEWNFNVPWAIWKQKLVKEMRQEFNDIIFLMNQALRLAAEHYNDPKIQYIDIDTAFHQHRFCEPGDDYRDQLNYGDKVYIWNNPAKMSITVKNENDVKTYESNTETPPPQDIVDKLKYHEEGKRRIESDQWIANFRDPQHPELTMEWKYPVGELGPYGSESKDGLIGRTLHPTQEGHRDVGNLIVQRLRQIYGRTDGRGILLSFLCPLGCTCCDGISTCTFGARSCSFSFVVTR